MPYFDRFDICQAYLALEIDWNVGGVLRERNHVEWDGLHDRPVSVGAQLSRMGFKPGLMFNGYESLSDNAREIYDAFLRKHRLCSGCTGRCWDTWGESCDTRTVNCECSFSDPGCEVCTLPPER